VPAARLLRVVESTGPCDSADVVETILVAASESRSPAEAVGRIIGFLVIPGIGLLLLILGLRQRGQSRRNAPPPPPQPGYPPYPGGPWQYPAQYPPQYPGQHPGWPPQPASPTRGTPLIAVGAVILALGLLGVVGALGAAALNVAKAGRLSVGECIGVDQYRARNLNAKAIDCSRDDALYELASKGDGTAKCPDGERDDSASYALLINDAITYCFALNAREGACYHLEVEDNIFEPVSCNSSESMVVQVDRRVDGSTDTSACGGDANAVTIPEPARVYCFVIP